MRITIVTDAWRPQVGGVVTTLIELARGLAEAGHVLQVIEPGHFARVAWWPGREVSRMLESFAPEALHIATEGPLGWAARRHVLRRGWRFSTAFHGRWPEAVVRSLRLSLAKADAMLRHFHVSSSAVMVPSRSLLDALARRRFSRLRQWTRGVAGPAELLGNSGAGVLHLDLRTAALRALARARDFDWADTTRQFLGHLLPVQPERVMAMSQQIHKLVP